LSGIAGRAKPKDSIQELKPGVIRGGAQAIDYIELQKEWANLTVETKQKHKERQGNSQAKAKMLRAS